MSDSSQLVNRALSLGAILVLMLVAPVLITRCNQKAASSDPEVRAVLIKPMPTRGGSEARFLRGEVYRNLPTHSPAAVAGRLQTVRELCASLQALEDGPLGRMTGNDADLVADVIAGLPFRDINQRIDWAKPIIGADTQFQEVLLSGGHSLGVIQCTDELAAAVAWARVADEGSGWAVELEECRRWGSACLQKLQERLKVNCSDADACAHGMRWREVTELRELLGKPRVGDSGGDPFSGYGAAALLDLADRINAAKLAQNPG